MNDKEVCDKMEEFAEKLFSMREPLHCIMPEKQDAQGFADKLLSIFFPHFGNKIFYSPNEIARELKELKANLLHILRPLQPVLVQEAEAIAEEFCRHTSSIHESLVADAKAIAEGDPAAENIDEVILAYPGFFAIAVFRIAHELYNLKVPLFPRMLTEYAHQQTGIDIHPGAKIGRSFFIDHGTGIVVGETTVIGDNVKLYQGVTLGALSVNKSLANSKRHPTIENDVIIYSGATILGGETIIGHHSVVGGNVWLTESIPAYSVVYHKSQMRVRSSREAETEPINFII